MVIAIDFDGTIVYDKFPDIGEIKPNAKEIINQLYNEGNIIIIWTCRYSIHEYKAKIFLENNDIKFHYINMHVPELTEKYKNDTRKLSYDVLIDDKNLGGIPDDWNKIYLMIKEHERKITTL
jgi:hypothetical protein